MRKTLLTAMALCLCGAMQAQIIHTDLSANPVVIGTDYPDELGYPINLMSGSGEFHIQNYGAMEAASYIACFSKGSGIVATGENYNVVPLSLNTVIGSSSSFNENTDDTPVFPVLHCNSQYMPTLTYTTWVGQTAYAGLKFKSGSNTYYGWIKLKVTETSNMPTFTLYGYAYNSTPGASIKAGEIGTSSLDGCICSDEIAESDFAIYPNPTQDFITIKTQGTGQVTITDLCGREMLSSTNLSTPLNVSSLNKGVYVLTLKNGDKTLTRKFIKQ
jgi:hypothetical protein